MDPQHSALARYQQQQQRQAYTAAQHHSYPMQNHHAAAALGQQQQRSFLQQQVQQAASLQYQQFSAVLEQHQKQQMVVQQNLDLRSYQAKTSQLQQLQMQARQMQQQAAMASNNGNNTGNQFAQQYQHFAPPNPLQQQQQPRPSVSQYLQSQKQQLQQQARQPTLQPRVSAPATAPSTFVIDTSRIAGSLVAPISTCPWPDSTKQLLSALPPPLAFCLGNCMAFRFHRRQRRTGDPTNANNRSTEADFFLNKLSQMKTTLAEEPLKLLGLRCACCLRSPNYIAGCTNFVNIADDPDVTLNIVHIVRNRLNHMVSCPYVKDKMKGVLFSYKLVSADKKLLVAFMETWVKAVKDLYYSHVFQPKLSHKRVVLDSTTLRLLRELHVTEESIADELAESFEAGYNSREKQIILEDLGDLLNTGTETPAMEDFLELFEVHIQENHDVGFTMGIHCRYCQTCIGDQHKLFQKDTSFSPKVIWSRVLHHCVDVDCPEIPKDVKRRFQARVDMPAPTADIVALVKAVAANIATKIRWAIPKVTPKLDLDAYRPLSLELLREYEPLPELASRKMEQPPPIPVKKLHSHDVIVGSEMHRELTGNRKFRQLISEHRCLYAKVSSEQQEVMAETLLNAVTKKQGGEFCTLDNDGVKYPLPTQKSLEHVTRALKHGFPEMVRPPLDRKSTSKVLAASFPAKVGIMHQQVKWNLSSASNPKYMLGHFRKIGHAFPEVFLEQPQQSQQQPLEVVEDTAATESSSAHHHHEVIVIESDEEETANNGNSAKDQGSTSMPLNSRAGPVANANSQRPTAGNERPESNASPKPSAGRTSPAPIPMMDAMATISSTATSHSLTAVSDDSGDAISTQSVEKSKTTNEQDQLPAAENPRLVNISRQIPSAEESPLIAHPENSSAVANCSRPTEGMNVDKHGDTRTMPSMGSPEKRKRHDDGPHSPSRNQHEEATAASTSKVINLCDDDKIEAKRARLNAAPATSNGSRVVLVTGTSTAVPRQKLVDSQDHPQQAHDSSSSTTTDINNQRQPPAHAATDGEDNNSHPRVNGHEVILID